MGLEESVKEQIGGWAKAKKDREWLIKNIKKVNDIYCDKPVLIKEDNTMILQQIKKMSFERSLFLIKGEEYVKWMSVIECSFNDKNYSVNFKRFMPPDVDIEGYTIIPQEYIPKELKHFLSK